MAHRDLDGVIFVPQAIRHANYPAYVRCSVEKGLPQQYLAEQLEWQHFKTLALHISELWKDKYGQRQLNCKAKQNKTEERLAILGIVT